MFFRFQRAGLRVPVSLFAPPLCSPVRSAMTLVRCAISICPRAVRNVSWGLQYMGTRVRMEQLQQYATNKILVTRHHTAPMRPVCTLSLSQLQVPKNPISRSSTPCSTIEPLAVVHSRAPTAYTQTHTSLARANEQELANVHLPLSPRNFRAIRMWRA